MRLWARSMFALLVVAACSAQPGPAVSTTTTIGPASGLEAGPLFVTEIEGAVTVDVASGGAQAAVAWITHDDVSVATVDVATGELTDQARVNGDLTPIAHPIERPAVRVDEEAIQVAFTSMSGDGAGVYLHSGRDEPELISGPPRPETNLVHMTTGPNGTPLLTWLEDATLSVARTVDGALVESEEVDDLTCDCCNPVPVVTEGSLVVAYRDFGTVDGEIVRDVAAVRSTDGGSSYGEPVQIADAHWFLSGCPFTGPDVVEADGALVVAWMDARQSVHPDQSDSTIWVDRSLDGGANFGTDLAVASDGRNRWPAITVDDAGVVHLVWETQGPEGGLMYAWSADGGETFSTPRQIVDREMTGGGAPGSPSVAYHEGHIMLTWADGQRGYVAAWPTAG